MSIELTALRLADGVWEGMLTGPDIAPELQVHVGEQQLEPPQVAPRDGGFLVRVPIAAEQIADGATVFVISTVESREKLASFVVLAGDVLREDLHAEVALLRAELDLVKRVIRNQARNS